MSSTSAAAAVEDPPGGKAESAQTPNGDISADEQSARAAAGPDVTESTPPATLSDTFADESADVTGEEAHPDTGEPAGAATPSAPEGLADRDAPPEPAAPASASASEAPQALTALTELPDLTVLTERISALEGAFELQQQAIADVGASVTDDLAGIAGSIALEVERFTTDELVDAKRNLSLAAHSMAHLALGITEAAGNVTGELGPDSIIALLHSFRAEVDNVLLQLGYTPLDTRVGEKFDPNRHRSLRRITTDDASKDRLIAGVIRDGYRSESAKRILVYSDVEVNRYQS